MSTDPVAGLDIGSVTAKCVVLRQGRALARALARTGARPEQAAAAVLAEARAQAGLAPDAPLRVIATGYSRRLVEGAGRVVTEIAAAGRGAWSLGGRQAALVVDVGGQDTKFIQVSAEGDVLDFLMNDKCAAGTGRFLELMAGVLGTDLAGLSDLALASAAPVAINATCSVFAESEVVSLIAHAARPADIAAGIFAAIADRLAAMRRHVGPADRLLFVGGGALSPALRRALEKACGQPLSVPEHPQFAVALGAALLGGG